MCFENALKACENSAADSRFCDLAQYQGNGCAMEGIAEMGDVRAKNMSRQKGSGDVENRKCFEQDFIINGRGQKLCCRYWPLYATPGKKPKALIFISHGFSEHLGLYDEVGTKFASEDILAFGHDHVGHGLSEGIRAYVESVDEYVDDVREHCERVTKMIPDVPLFIVAHSMGGMIALRAVLNHPDMFKGMILNGPLIIPGPSIGPFDARVTPGRAFPVRCLLSVLDAINPEMVLGSVYMNAITRDPEMVKMLERCHLRWSQGVKVRLLLAFVTCLEENLSLINSVDIPFLTLHGTADTLCNSEGSHLLYDNARSSDKQIHIFPKAVHHLFLEIPEVRNVAIAETVAWVKARATKTSSSDDEDSEKEKDEDDSE